MLIAWLVLAGVLIALAVTTVRDTGLDYDEAVYGHLAKDFLTGRQCAQHMPGSESVAWGGRPFPVFVQGYLGAVKCWLLIPSFAVFGTSVAVMRWTMLAAGLVGLLFLMLWTRRTLGGPAAVLTGFLVGLDPALFFPTVCEWGAFVPSFVCRCAGLFFLIVWWRDRRVRWMCLGGAALGLGFFNKIDFIVVMLALAVAALATRPREIFHSLRSHRWHWTAGAIAFVVTGSLMIVNLARWFRAVLAVQSGPRTDELTTKLNVAQSVLDGSYFYRLMETGGLFHRMFETAAPVWSPFGLGFGVAVVVLIVGVAADERKHTRGWPMFLLVGLLVVTAGVAVLPDAVRVHHALLIYPFPQLIIAMVAVRAWSFGTDKTRLRPVSRSLAVLTVFAVLAGHITALWRTQRFIATTGGRGEWSTALTEFAAEMRTREDAMLVSFDWGFHEQLSFLTESPQRFEPTWNLQEGKPVALLPDPRCYYLIHPPEFSLFPYGEEYLQAARAADPNLVVESRTNREGRVVFQFFRFARQP